LHVSLNNVDSILVVFVLVHAVFEGWEKLPNLLNLKPLFLKLCWVNLDLGLSHAADAWSGGKAVDSGDSSSCEETSDQGLELDNSPKWNCITSLHNICLVFVLFS